MSIHDWTKVEAPIFRAFHHGWISTISDALNRFVLPKDLYALPELVAAEYGSDHPPQHRKSPIAIRQVEGDWLLAIIEIVSPDNKISPQAVRSFVQRACELAEDRIHFLIVDLFPPGQHDPNGVEGLIWQELRNKQSILFPEKPLTIVSYHCEETIEAYIDSIAVGDVLPDMPLFLAPNGCIKVPLEITYLTAFELLPRRWRDVLQPPKTA